MGEIVAGSVITTVRIPELPERTDGVDLSLSDQIPIWIASEDKTKKTSLQTLMTFLATGGGSTSTVQVIIGDELVYIVPEEQDHATSISIPILAGKNFSLNRGGLIQIPEEEYEVLLAGGVSLPREGDEFRSGERLVFRIFEQPGGDTIITNSGGFINSTYAITSNLTLNASHVSRLGQIRHGVSPITVTLPNVSDVSGNPIVVLESLISTTLQSKIQGNSGQKIYMNNESKDYVYLSAGESIILLRKDDGWYLIDNGFGQIYRSIGKIVPGFSASINQLICSGQELNRADHPRLFEYAQSLGSSYVSDAVWNTAQVYYKNGVFYTSAPASPYDVVLKPYRGCFSSGNGTNTFRLPDLRNVALRGLLSEAGSDTERYLNRPGGFQNNILKSHTHGPVTGTSTGHSSGSDPESGSTKWLVNGDPESANSNIINSDSGPVKNETTHTETRMDNVGIFWLINE